MIRFGILFPEICVEKFINFELSSQIYVKIKDLDYLLRNQQIFVQNKVLRLSKGLLGEISSIKEFTFEPIIEYQILKLTAELHLTKKILSKT